MPGNSWQLSCYAVDPSQRLQAKNLTSVISKDPAIIRREAEDTVTVTKGIVVQRLQGNSIKSSQKMMFNVDLI